MFGEKEMEEVRFSKYLRFVFQIRGGPTTEQPQDNKVYIYCSKWRCPHCNFDSVWEREIQVGLILDYFCIGVGGELSFGPFFRKPW